MTDSRATVQVFAPAKLTLSLRMTGLRSDGFHLIEAEMVTLDFGDDLLITPSPGVESSLVMELHTGRDDPSNPMVIPDGQSNLVLQAMRMVGRMAQIRLIKRIPPGAGLGGGSADAAAVLRWAQWHDVAGAAAIGADVPFCVVGGRARVTGIGEEVEPLPFVDRKLTLLTPPFGCRTPAVYRAWDELGGPRGQHNNDLEPAALVVEPRLAQWRDRLQEASGVQPQLAGSGATWFVEGHHEVEGGRQVCTTPTSA